MKQNEESQRFRIARLFLPSWKIPLHNQFDRGNFTNLVSAIGEISLSINSTFQPSFERHFILWRVEISEPYWCRPIIFYQTRHPQYTKGEGFKVFNIKFYTVRSFVLYDGCDFVFILILFLFWFCFYFDFVYI